MNKLTISLISVLCIFPQSSTSATGDNKTTIFSPQFNETTISFKNLFASNKKISKLLPTKKVKKKFIGKQVKLDGKTYEIRFMFYETLNRAFNKMPLGKFLEHEKLLKTHATSINHGYANLIFFSIPKKIADEKKVFFMLSLRQVKPKSIAKIKSEQQGQVSALA